MELLLEREIEELKKQNRVLQKKYLAEKRARAHLRSQLDKLFSVTSAGDHAVVRSALGRHLIRACRGLCRESYDSLSQCRKDGTMWIDSDKLGIDRSDLLSLLRLFNGLNWTDSSATDSNGRISVSELLNGLEAFLSWQIEEQKLGKDILQEKIEGNDHLLSSPSFLKLKTLALRCRTEEDDNVSILSWFPEEAARSPDYCIHYTDFNECIFTATRTAFDDARELLQCLEYLNERQWISADDLQKFVDRKTINVAGFCSSLQSFALSEKPFKLPQLVTLEDSVTSDEEKVAERKEDAKVELDVELEMFSFNEHSSCWAPLSRFGRPPFECVRLLNGKHTAEYNTTSSRSIMAFLDGEILDTNKRIAVSLVKEKSIRRGSWALCVTSTPPMNRPVKGSCVYNSVAGDATSFAYVQGKDVHNCKCSST